MVVHVGVNDVRRVRPKELLLRYRELVDICRRLERGESRQQLMVEYGVGSSTIYDIKSQTKKLRDYMKVTDTPKTAENHHTLQYHHQPINLFIRGKY